MTTIIKGILLNDNLIKRIKSVSFDTTENKIKVVNLNDLCDETLTVYYDTSYTLKEGDYFFKCDTTNGDININMYNFYKNLPFWFDIRIKLYTVGENKKVNIIIPTKPVGDSMILDGYGTGKKIVLTAEDDDVIIEYIADYTYAIKYMSNTETITIENQ